MMNEVITAIDVYSFDENIHESPYTELHESTDIQYAEARDAIDEAVESFLGFGGSVEAVMEIVKNALARL